MRSGGRPAPVTNEFDRRAEAAAKSFTRIALMCARGEEVAWTQRSAQKAQGPPRRQARWSPSTAAQAEGASTGEAAGEGGATRAPAREGKAAGPDGSRRPARDRGQVAICG